ncbi:VOC family protein [Streptomyces sp. DT24]|uniref:VOC family protein n=1 Tax=unclassified Streptomyces TaxID=2593676 RepID=UPI003CF81E65
MTVRGIDHVGLTVPDLETATHFLVRAFGAKILYDTLRREEEPRKGPDLEKRLGVPKGTRQRAIRMLSLPNGPGVELFEFSGPRQEPPVLPCDFGWQHVALYTDELDEAVENCVSAGAALLAPPHPLPGPEEGERNRFAYLRAPWGSILELVSYPDPQPYERTTAERRWRP